LAVRVTVLLRACGAFLSRYKLRHGKTAVSGLSQASSARTGTRSSPEPAAPTRWRLT
jgi:hypothetical protein